MNTNRTPWKDLGIDRNTYIKEKLEDHQRWQTNRGGKQADFSNLDLCGADFIGADCGGVNFDAASLCFANFRGANCCGAYFNDADLEYAEFSYANLRAACLNRANLARADFSYANLSFASFVGAKFDYAKNYGALFDHAYLSKASGVRGISLACPSEGSFIAWKKVSLDNEEYSEYREESFVLAKLLIPEDAKRVSATSNKCRCNKATVLAIEDWRTGELFDVAYSLYDPDFIYKVGETIISYDFDEDRWAECSRGIHFFVDKQMAIEY